MNKMGKVLMVIGAVFFIAGALISFFPKIPLLGKLPGDIFIQKENFKFYFPITTSILISIILSTILYVINKMR